MCVPSSTPIIPGIVLLNWNLAALSIDWAWDGHLIKWFLNWQIALTTLFVECQAVDFDIPNFAVTDLKKLKKKKVIRTIQ